MENYSSTDDFVVDLRLHTLSGLPLSDPPISITVKTNTTSWTTAVRPSFSGISFIGARTSIVIRGSDALSFELAEAAPGISCLRGGFLGGTSTVNLSQHASDSTEAPLKDLTLLLQSSKGAGEIITEKVEQRVAQQVAKLDGASSTTDAQAAEHQEQGEADKIQGGIYSAGTLRLRLSLRVTPLNTHTEQGQLAAGDVNDGKDAVGVLLEQGEAIVETDITHLPRELHSYAHGGFMGLAASILADPKWSDILKREDPGAWAALQKTMLTLKVRGRKDARPNAAQGKYMMDLENSPVLCAWGLIRSGCTAPFDQENQGATAGRAIKTATAAPTQEIQAAPQTSSSPGLEPPVPQTMTTTIPSSTTHVNSVQSVNCYSEPPEALLKYQAAMAQPNRYGYRPLGMEWDIWVHPHHPASLVEATILHGTQSALVMQAITTTVPGLKACARSSGVNQIINDGLSPPEWLTQLGNSINNAVNGNTSVPLPLLGPEASTWRMTAKVNRVDGVESGRWTGLQVQASICASDGAMLPDAQTELTRVDCTTDGSFCSNFKQTLTFWPLPEDLSGEVLVLKLHGDLKGLGGGRNIGVAKVQLAELLSKHMPADGSSNSVQDIPLEITLSSASPKKHAAADADSGSSSSARTTPRISLSLSFERVGVLSAAENLGIPRAAAQTAIAMLSSPGGLYLDVKSAYSSANEISMFVTSLRGLGLTCKAVCSFKPEQLQINKQLADTVLFFHGLAGLENACAGANAVPPGQFVLFNGASFLKDLHPSEFLFMSANDVNQELGNALAWPWDELAVQKYLSLVERHNIVGGIYIQEPGAAPAAVDALCKLVATYPDAFPLGFAYGHLSGRAVSFFDASERGFASQQILEEMAARKDLANRTQKLVANGEHRTASLTTQIAWASRLLHGEDWMSLAEQKSLCVLLADAQTDADAAAIINGVGGINRCVARFHDHYELNTPLTLMEAGFNRNYTKSLLRILRNRGVFAGLSLHAKIGFATFAIGPPLRGYGATFLLQASKIRRGLHKHAKEALLCLLESCTAEEFNAIVNGVGERDLNAMLRGRLKLSFTYSGRFSKIKQLHAQEPKLLAYLQYPAYLYGALPAAKQSEDSLAENGKVDIHAATHTRDKLPRVHAWRAIRKSFCCCCTTWYSVFLELITAGTFIPCCVLPRCCGNALRGACGAPAVLAGILGFILAVGIIIFFAFIKDEVEDAYYPNAGSELKEPKI